MSPVLSLVTVGNYANALSDSNSPSGGDRQTCIQRSHWSWQAFMSTMCQILAHQWRRSSSLDPAISVVDMIDFLEQRLR